MIGAGYALSRFGGKPPKPDTGPAELRVRVNRRYGVAPLGVHFEAMMTGGGVKDKYRDVYFLWDFGDPGAVYSNLRPDFPHGNDANTATGPLAAHVYAGGGVFTATVTAYWYENGALNSLVAATDPVTVEDPETFFTGADTVVCSLVGDFTGAPAGAAQVTSIADLQADMNARRKDEKARVLLRGGETFAIDATSLGLREVTYAWLGGFGPGRPVLEAINSGQSFVNGTVYYPTDCENVHVSDLEFLGGYDPVAAELAANKSRATGIFAYTTKHLTVWDVKSRGMNITVYPVDHGVIGSTRTVGNCDIGDWLNYGLFGGGHKYATLGNTLRQNPATPRGGDFKQYSTNPMYADHGPMRIISDAIYDTTYQVHSRNDLYSRSGWSGYGLDDWAIQPSMRVQMPKNDGARVVVTQNALEGGFVIMQIDIFGKFDEFTMRTLIEANHFVGDEQTDVAIQCAYTGATIRNNVIVKRDLPENLGNFYAIYNQKDPKGLKRVSHPVTLIEHNTLVNEQSAANVGPGNLDLFRLPVGGTMPVVTRQNVVRADTVSNAASLTDYGPLDAADFYRPLAGSAAIGAAAADFPVADFTGAIRPAGAAAGALEP